MAESKENHDHDIEAQENRQNDAPITTDDLSDTFDFRNDDMVNRYIKFYTTRHLNQGINASSVTLDDISNSPDAPPIDKQTLLSLIVVYFSVFLDDMGVSIVSPILPFYAAKFGADSVELGILLAVYQLFMAFSSYGMGKLSDKYGRRKLVLYSLFGTMAGFTLTGFSFDYASLVIFRAITGCFGGSRSIANAYITDVVPRAQRAKYLAFTSLAMSFAFIIGPIVGSSLSIWNIRIPFFVSGGLGATGLVFAYFVMLESPVYIEKRKKIEQEKHKKDTSSVVGLADDKKNYDNNNNKNDKKTELESKQDNKKRENVELGTVDTMQEMEEVEEKEIISQIPSQIWAIGVSNVFNLTCFTAFGSMFAFYAIVKFDVSTLAIGYIILIAAVTMVFTTILILNPMHKLIGPYFTSVIASIILGTFLGLIPIIGENNLYFAAMCGIIACGIGGGLGYPSSSVMAVEYTNINNRGTVMAFNEMTVNLGQVVGPVVHGIAFGSISANAMFYFAGVYGFCAAIAIAGVIATNSNTRIQCNTNCRSKSKNKNKDELIDVNSKDWQFKHDEPKTKDFKRLGTFLGNLMIERNYNWITHWHLVQAHLNESLPPVRTDSFQHHVEDLMYLRSQVIGMRNQYDLNHPQI